MPLAGAPLTIGQPFERVVSTQGLSVSGITGTTDTAIATLTFHQIAGHWYQIIALPNGSATSAGAIISFAVFEDSITGSFIRGGTTEVQKPTTGVSTNLIMRSYQAATTVTKTLVVAVTNVSTGSYSVFSSQSHYAVDHVFEG